MRVLVTRPEEAARRTAAKIAALGHQAVLLPLMAAEHHPQAALNALRQPHAAVAITSAETARVLRTLGEALHPYLQDNLFAVGDATADALRATGFTSVLAAEGTGASMVERFLPQLRQLTSPHPLLYLAGQPRSPVFEEDLKVAGIPVATIVSYTMTPLPVSDDAFAAALKTPPVDAVLLYSKETAKRFFELMGRPEDLNILARLRILCLSDNVAQAVPNALKDHVATALRPDEDSLLALL
ncbi:MAG: uroporphyrinogen-III synthase [Pseudorhizobium sp.]